VKAVELVLDDDLLARALEARTRPADCRLMTDVLARTVMTPQIRPWWSPIDLRVRRAVVALVIVALLLAIALAAGAGARLIEHQLTVPRNGEVVIGGRDCQLRLVNPVTGSERDLARQAAVCDGGGAMSYAVTASMDGSHVAYALNESCGGCTSAVARLEVAPAGYWVLDVLSGVTRKVADCSPSCDDVALSPDGQRLAYSAFGDQEGLRIMSLGDLEVRNFTIDGEPSSPAFSPDGRRVAVIASPPADCSQTSCAPPSLASVAIVAPEDGSVATAFSETGTLAFSPEWSPVDNNVLAIGARGPDGTDTILLLAADGGMSHGLDLPDMTSRELGTMRWSPDGTAIAYEVERHEADGRYSSELWVSPLDGSVARRIATPGCCSLPLDGFAFSPDGSEIAVSVADADRQNFSGIVAIPVRGGTPQRVATIDPAMGGAATDLVWLEAQ
jgi:dipeptidyl aminopeptidase/acylaminoacyl peptidase